MDEFFGFVELQVERGGFDVACSDEAPFAVGHAFDEAALDIILRFELGDEGADVAVVILAVFVEEDGGLGLDAVFDGVAAGESYRFLIDEFNHARAFTLEAMVVAILIIDLAMALVKFR